MPFVFLLLFALLSFQGTWPEPPDWLGSEGALAAPAVLVALAWLLAGRRAHRFAAELARDPDCHADLWRDYLRGRRRHTFAVVVGYLAVLFYFGWGHAAREQLGFLATFP